MDLLKKKWFVSYDYWNSFAKLKKRLHKKDKFYNTITNRAISDKNCKHVLNVWKAFKVSDMKDYDDLYFKVDVLLLAWMFETFKDPVYYLSISGYSWDAMLRLTDVNLKLISDTEKYQCIESTMRSGISMICKGYAELIINYKNHMMLTSLFHILYT